MWSGSHSQQVGMKLGVSVFLRPEIQRDGGEFVDERVGQTVLREVNRLDVGLAGVAALDADVGECFSGVDGKLGVIFLAAPGTDDAAEFPFDEAKPAKEAAAASVALLAEDAQRRLPIAERAERMGVAVELQANLRTGEFRVGLQEGQSEKFFGIRRRRAGREPASVQQIRPSARGGALQTASDLGEEGRPALFNDCKE